MRKAFVVLALALLGMSAWAQDKGKDRVEDPVKAVAKTLNPPPVVCTFADGKQVSVRYKRPPVERRGDLPEGKVWPPSASMFLFTPVALTIGNSVIPAGAFSLYVIRGHDDWTLIVNKNVTEGAKYDEMEDLLRTAMKIGELGQPATELTVYFAHIAPKQCNMRLYYGKTGSWAEFQEQ